MLHFDADGQKLIWMTNGQKYESTIHRFAWMPGLEHQLTMEPKSWIHTFEVLKLDEMQFMYALGAKARSPKIQNFLPKLNTLYRLLRATLTLRIGDATTCPRYERNLIQFYMEKRPFSVFDFIL
jgi:hypothetical protein